MANEAVIIELLGNGGDPIRYTVADGVGIAEGTLLTMTDPRSAVATSADNEAFAGIATAEKVASDGSVTLAAYTHGVFDLLDSGAGVTVGERVSIKGANCIAKCAAADLLFADVGIAMETATAAETIAVLIGSGF